MKKYPSAPTISDLWQEQQLQTPEWALEAWNVLHKIDDDSTRVCLAESLCSRRENYEASGNEYEAMYALILCLCNEAQPPTWVSNWLKDGFIKFSRSLTDDSIRSDLGKCLGLGTQPNTNRPKPDNETRWRLFKNITKRQVLFLMAQYGFTRDQACDIAASLNRRMPAKPKKLIALGTIVSMYKHEKWQNELPETFTARAFFSAMQGTPIELRGAELDDPLAHLEVLHRYQRGDLEAATRDAIIYKQIYYCEICKNKGIKMSDKFVLEEKDKVDT